jgi:hypothetical protein
MVHRLPSSNLPRPKHAVRQPVASRQLPVAHNLEKAIRKPPTTLVAPARHHRVLQSSSADGDSAKTPPIAEGLSLSRLQAHQPVLVTLDALREADESTVHWLC